MAGGRSWLSQHRDWRTRRAEGFVSFNARRGARRKRGLATLLKEVEDVGSDRRARFANRILKEFLGDVEKRESPTLFARSEKKRLKTDSDARTYVANRSEVLACRQGSAEQGEFPVARR